MSERITLAQLAAISMLTERTLRSYLKRGLLAGEKTPGGWRFTAEQTAAFLALPQVCSASNARRNAVAEDFIQRRMDTTGQLCAVLDLPVAAAAAFAGLWPPLRRSWRDHGFQRRCALSRVTLRGPAQDVLAALQALSVYFPGKILPDFRLKFRRDFIMLWERRCRRWI